MYRGYVKVYRKSLDKGWVRNHKLWSVWTYCLMKATYKKTEVIVGLRVIKLEPGQFVFGRKVASEDLNIPEATIYRHIKFLESVGNIEIKPNNRFSIISIINWIAYQDTENKNGQQMDNKRTTNGHIQEGKEVKNKDKKIYGEFKNVKLTDVELDKLKSKFKPSYLERIENLSRYIENFPTKGKKYKSHYATILTWARKDVKQKPNKNSSEAFVV